MDKVKVLCTKFLIQTEIAEGHHQHARKELLIANSVTRCRTPRVSLGS